MSHSQYNYRPKILSINNYYYRRGGSEAVFIDHDQLFSSNNWDTALFAMHHPNNLRTSWSDYFVRELEFGNNYSFIQKLIMAGKVIYSWEARQKLVKLLDVFSPDVAHIHCIYHHLSPSILSILKNKGIPSIMTAHDLKIACPAYKMLNHKGICEKCKRGNLLHLVKNRCIHDSLSISTLIAVESALHKFFGLYKNNLDIIVTPSHFFRKKFIEWGWNEKNISYIPNYIDSGSYVPQYNAGRYFLYFGRLAPEKGVDTLIKAALNTGISLIIAGTGPYEKHLNAIASDHENISFVGYKSGKDLTDLIRNARCVVLPSEWYENAPISILESYACGKPVIGANIGGIPEMLLDGETGVIFESRNVEDLSEKLLFIDSASNSKIMSLGKNSRNFVSSTFTPERYYYDMMKLYKSQGVKTYI